MSKKEIPFETICKIYEIIKEIYKLEKIFKEGKNRKKEKLFLIDKNIFDGYKNNISYEILKKDIEKKERLDVVKLIMNYFKPPKKLKFVSSINIHSSKDLLDKLDNQNKFNIINSDLAIKIFNKEKSDQIKFENNENGIFYEIKNNMIIIYFNKKECLNFEVN